MVGTVLDPLARLTYMKRSHFVFLTWLSPPMPIGGLWLMTCART